MKFLLSLLFNGGGGSGAFAETVIESGSGRVIDVINLQGGSNYASAPAVQPFHPVKPGRTQRNRVLSNSNFLYTTQLTASINSTDTSISVENAYFNNGQGFPNQGELLIPYWNSSASVWSTERILYSTVDYNSNVFTVTTNGRGNKRTGPSTGVGHAISIEMEPMTLMDSSSMLIWAAHTILKQEWSVTSVSLPLVMPSLLVKH